MRYQWLRVARRSGLDIFFCRLLILEREGVVHVVRGRLQNRISHIADHAVPPPLATNTYAFVLLFRRECDPLRFLRDGHHEDGLPLEDVRHRVAARHGRRHACTAHQKQRCREHRADSSQLHYLAGRREQERELLQVAEEWIARQSLRTAAHYVRQEAREPRGRPQQ
jgi:hypothetical protein